MGQVVVIKFIVYTLILEVEIILVKDTSFVLPVSTCLRAIDLPAQSNIIDIFLLGDVLSTTSTL